MFFVFGQNVKLYNTSSVQSYIFMIFLFNVKENCRLSIILAPLYQWINSTNHKDVVDFRIHSLCRWSKVASGLQQKAKGWCGEEHLREGLHFQKNAVGGCRAQAPGVQWVLGGPGAPKARLTPLTLPTFPGQTNRQLLRSTKQVLKTISQPLYMLNHSVVNLIFFLIFVLIFFSIHALHD